MKIARLLTALWLVLGLAGAAAAQGTVREGQLALLYDVDSTSLTYCVIQGADGGPFSEPKRVTPKIKTSGSSTTVTAFTAGSAPFTNVVAGDVLVIQTPSTTNALLTTVVAVTAVATTDSITVDTAITLGATAGHTFGYYHHVCGTTAADGWFAVPSASERLALTVQYDQGDLGALVARWECKTAGAAAAPVILYPGGSSDCGGIGFALATDRCSATTAPAALTVVDASPSFSFCRVGLAYSASDTSDATTNREKVTIRIAVR